MTKQDAYTNWIIWGDKCLVTINPDNPFYAMEQDNG